MKQQFAACPLDEPATSRREAEHPRKAAPNFVVQEISRAEATLLVEEFHYAGMLPYGGE